MPNLGLFLCRRRASYGERLAVVDSSKRSNRKNKLYQQIFKSTKSLDLFRARQIGRAHV